MRSTFHSFTAERTCSEWVAAGLRSSHVVDVDPDGEDVLEEPFRVFCDVTSDNGTATFGTLHSSWACLKPCSSNSHRLTPGGTGNNLAQIHGLYPLTVFVEEHIFQGTILRHGRRCRVSRVRVSTRAPCVTTTRTGRRSVCAKSPTTPPSQRSAGSTSAGSASPQAYTTRSR